MTPTAPRRIAVGSIFIECNQFGGVPADLARFEQYELQRNSDVLTMTNGAVGGMSSALSASRSNIQPLLVASTCPSGPVTPECYETLKQELLHSITASLPLDGILLALHGAGAVLETFHDSGANRQTALPAPLLADNSPATSATGASSPTTGNVLARSNPRHARPY